MISKTPLILEGYVFTKLLVEANPGYTIGKEIKDQEIEFSLGIEVGKDLESESRYQVSIHIANLRAKDTNTILPYTVEAKAIGVFTVDKDFKIDNWEKLIQVNGASMLFGAAREQILALTGRGPYGPMKLPTINLLAVTEEQATEITEKK